MHEAPVHYHKRQQATQNPCQLILAASIEVETSSKLSTLLSPLAPQLCCNHVCTQALQSNTMRKLLPPDLQIDTAALILAFVMMHPLFLSTQSTACLDTGTWYLSIAGHSSQMGVYFSAEDRGQPEKLLPPPLQADRLHSNMAKCFLVSA